MDWKEKGIEATYLGGLAVAGAWILKKIKPFSKEIIKLSKLSDRVDIIEERINTQDRRISVDENYMNAIFDNSLTAIFRLDHNFELVYVNTAWVELAGFSSDEEAYGVGFLKAIPDRFKAAMRDQMESSKKHPSRFSEKIPFRNIKTKIEFEMLCRSTPVYDNKNIVCGTLGFLYPINN
jgi:PAS domain S-box-containing protein